MLRSDVDGKILEYTALTSSGESLKANAGRARAPLYANTLRTLKHKWTRLAKETELLETTVKKKAEEEEALKKHEVCCLYYWGFPSKKNVLGNERNSRNINRIVN